MYVCMSVCLYLPMIIYVSMCICTYACLLARPHVGIVGELGLVVFSPSRVGTYVLHIFRDKEKKTRISITQQRMIVDFFCIFVSQKLSKTHF